MSIEESNRKVLFLDDIRNPEEVTWMKYAPDLEFIVVRNFQEFIREVENNPPFYGFSLDHDLQDFDENGKELDGEACLRAVPDDKLPKVIAIHSKNPIGCQRIRALIQDRLS